MIVGHLVQTYVETFSKVPEFPIGDCRGNIKHVKTDLMMLK